MNRLLIIILSSLLIAWSPTNLFYGTTGTTEVCVGAANTACVPDADSFTNYGVSGDRAYGRIWTATENGTAVSINARWGIVSTPPSYIWLALYNGTTLVGFTDDLTSALSAGAWSGYVTLNVVGGQTLTFSTSDNLYISVVYDNGVTALASIGSAGSPAIQIDSTAITATPNTTASWTPSGSNNDLAVVLKYVK